MKIALVALGYPSENVRGGIGSQTYVKAHALAAMGHKVYVVSRSTDKERNEYLDEDVHVFRIPGLEQMLCEMTEVVQWITHSIVVASELETLHTKVNLDIIEFPEWGAEGYIYLLNRTDWNKVPVVIQLHGPLVMLAQQLGWPDFNSPFYKVGTQMEATCIQLADAIYSSSECTAQWVRSNYKPKNREIPIIHTGVDTMTFKPGIADKPKNPTIVFVGRLVQNKGAEELVDAVIDLSSKIKGLRLKLLGSGEEMFIQNLKSKLEKQGATDIVDFVGFVQREDLPRELSKAHLFAAPSYYEGGPGFVYLEAMACGIPVIGCNGSGIEETISNGVNGILVPPRDVKALKDAIEQIVTNVNFSKALGNGAREYAETLADSNKCMLKLEAFYQSVVQNCGNHNYKTEKSLALNEN